MNKKAAALLGTTAGLPSGAVIVEVGCARTDEEVASDGWSTIYLALAAKNNGWQFHSVDIDAIAIRRAHAATDGLPVEFHQAEGAAFLCKFDVVIDLLYLDGDADPGEALHQYEEAKLGRHARVVVDDCQQIGEHPNGKATLLFDRLLHDGFEIEVVETEPGYLMLIAKR